MPMARVFEPLFNEQDATSDAIEPRQCYWWCTLCEAHATAMDIYDMKTSEAERTANLAAVLLLPTAALMADGHHCTIR